MNKDDYLVINITSMIGTYIAKVTQVNPFGLKVKEEGPLAHLRDGDFIILEQDTVLLQKDDLEGSCVFLEQEKSAGRKVISGLRCLGVKDDKLYEILPG